VTDSNQPLFPIPSTGDGANPPPHGYPQIGATPSSVPATVRRSTSGRQIPQSWMITGGAVVAILAVIVAVVALVGSGDSHQASSQGGGDSSDPSATWGSSGVPEQSSTFDGAETATPSMDRRSATEVALNVSVPISQPTCDGSGIVVLGSAIRPGNYDDEIQRLLNRFPGAGYLRTDYTCPSLRPRSDAGTPIYAVYRPAGRTQSDVCAAVRSAGGDAYGKWLDMTTDPGYMLPC